MRFDDIFRPATVENAVENAVGRYNVAPTQQVAIIERTAEQNVARDYALVAGARVGEEHQGQTAVDQRALRQGAVVEAVAFARGEP